jgi:hypothetical protein
MSIKKTVPMAGTMGKLASNDLSPETATVEGEDWSVTIPKDLYERVGPGVVESFMESALDMMRSATQYPPSTEEEQ